MTDLHRLSKPDTVLLLDDAEADLFTDLSQERTGLKDETTYLAEEPSPRAALAGDREIAVVIDIGPDTAGTVLYHGHASGTPYTYRIVIADDKVQLYEDGENILSVAVPDLDSEPGPFLVHWSSRSTGPGTARSELLIYNLTSGADAHGFDDHATGTPDAAHALYVGAVDGANGYSEGISAIHSVRIGTAFHSLVEAREDWIGESTAPALASETRLEAAPVDGETDAAAEGELYGPAMLHTAEASTQADLRLWSPLVNEVYRQASIAPSFGYEFAPTRHATKAPKSDYLHLLLRHTWRRPVPPSCRRARARVHVTMWPTAGADVCSVQFQIWSFDALLDTYKGVGPEPKYSATSIVSRAVSDGSSTGAGAWVDLGNLYLLERDGLTWLSLGVGFAEGDSDPALEETLVRINAVQIEPTYPTPAADFDIGDD